MRATARRQSEQIHRPSMTRTLWAWLRDLWLSPDPDWREPSAPSASPVAPIAHEAASTDNAGEPDRRGVLLSFPIRGEALLVKLASVLRNRIVDDGPVYDRLLLTVSRCPQSRLSIDSAAYVDFDPTQGVFRAVIEASPGTKVILETSDFDALVDFVLQYIASRSDASRPWGEAS